MKDRPVAERLQRFKEGLAALIHETDVEAIPTLAISPSSMAAQITLIDLQDDVMLAQFGRTRKTPAPETKPEEPPTNPRAN